jgi:transposase-like protein
MQERGVAVGHSTIHWWVLKYAPQLEHTFCKQKRSEGAAVYRQAWSWH